MTTAQLAAATPPPTHRRWIRRGSAAALVWALLEADGGWHTLAAISAAISAHAVRTARLAPTATAVHRAAWRLAERGLVSVAHHDATGEAVFALPDRDVAEDRRALYCAGLQLCRHGCPAGFPTETGRAVHEGRWCRRRPS